VGGRVKGLVIDLEDLGVKRQISAENVFRLLDASHGQEDGLSVRFFRAGQQLLVQDDDTLLNLLAQEEVHLFQLVELLTELVLLGVMMIRAVIEGGRPGDGGDNLGGCVGHGIKDRDCLPLELLPRCHLFLRGAVCWPLGRGDGRRRQVDWDRLLGLRRVPDFDSPLKEPEDIFHGGKFHQAANGPSEV